LQSMFFRFTALFLFSVVCFSTYSQTGSVKGFIKDATTGVELENILIEVSGTKLDILSNSEGYYIVTNIPVGTHYIVATGFNYVDDSIKVEIKDDKVVVLNFYLKQAMTNVGVSPKGKEGRRKMWI
jgi:hypothetical protein